MKEIKALQCDHCNKLYREKAKYHAKRHEKVCKHNPDNFTPCFQCKYFEPSSTCSETAEGYNGREFEIEVRTPAVCKKHDKYMSSAKTIQKNNGRNGEFKNKYPNTCKDFSANSNKGTLKGTIAYKCLSEEQRKEEDKHSKQNDIEIESNCLENIFG